ncbi:MAG: fumarate hydratase C-terminal domain-containing protein [Clostridia bacterium]|nr:fumarate hydratase C-terminal domain-containing protein [Clostridia bacterium]
MATYYLNIPLKEEDVTKLKIGDIVYVSGDVFTGRSRLQKYVFDEKNQLGFSIENKNVFIHVGPVIVKENGEWDMKSFMPTSSIRFEKWGAKSVQQWDLRMIIGKTTMGQETMNAMQKYKCVHVSPQAVSPNLWLDSLTIQDVHLFEELGSIEASWQLKADKLGPFVVDIDCYGNNLFDGVTEKVEENKRKVFEKIGIPADFSYTKLY